MSKKKLAIFTATGCRACESGVSDIHYQVSSMSEWADIVFWPYLLGSEWNDLENEEKIDVCFFAGALSTDKDREAAIKLREKSRIMVALGACSAFGGLPGLANLTGSQRPAASDQQPATSDQQPAALPQLESRVSGLSQVVETEYIVPGCPVPQNLLWTAIQALVCDAGSGTNLSFAVSRLPEPIAQSVTAGILPPKGSIFAGEKAVCASCSRVKEEKRFESFKRPYEPYEESGRCLLEQGLVCQGIATREGCGGICTGVGIPCRGCFGKAEAVFDPGANMVSAISSTFDTEDESEIEEIAGRFRDLAGTFYRYTLPSQCALMRDARNA